MQKIRIRKYGLNFISDTDLFNHVKQTVDKYRATICLKDFNKNLIDPIKLTFDKLIYRKKLEEVIESEILRQLDKSNNNHIGYFHQNIFKYVGHGWSVPKKGYDVVNYSRKIYVEVKNKHNTMNSSSAQSTYMKMLKTLSENPKATCMLVEVIATKSQNTTWKLTYNGEKSSDTRIRRVSIDKFYELVTDDHRAFKSLCQQIPRVIEDVINSGSVETYKNTVYEELLKKSPSLLTSLYLLSFSKYEGFKDLHV
jgi:hypothetical protein